MTRNNVFAIAFATLLLFTASCASGGMKRTIIYADQPNNIPADIPSQFLDRYYFLIDKERKEFKKLLTDEERQVFIDKFWDDRDTDPATPENEEKQRIDHLIDNIADEHFLNTLGVFGLSFRTNGGFRGNMARVYLLHDEPDAIDILEGNSFVPLMLWIYGNPENGSILYAFLFYQKGGFGERRLFFQDSYQMDRCEAIYQVATPRIYNYIGGGSQVCPDDLYEVYDEIAGSSSRGGILNGNWFAWALFNFSGDPSLKLGKALEPPKSASKVAKESKARVVGEAPKLTGTAGVDYILSSCDSCNSMIPAELTLGENFSVSALWKNFDWLVKDDYLELSLKYRIVLQDHNGSKPIVFEDLVVKELDGNLVEMNQGVIVAINLLESSKVAVIPSGTYSVSVYIKSTLTPKYNAWLKEIVLK